MGEAWLVEEGEYLRDIAIGSSDEDIAAATSSLVLCSIDAEKLSAPPLWLEARLRNSGAPDESQIGLLENAAGGSGEVQQIVEAAVVSLVEHHIPKEEGSTALVTALPAGSSVSVSARVSARLDSAIEAVVNLPDGGGAGAGAGECGQRLAKVAGHLLFLSTGIQMKALAAVTMMSSLAVLLGQLLMPGNIPPLILKSTVESMARKAATATCAASVDPNRFADNLLAAARGGVRINFTATELNKLCAAAAGGVVTNHHGSAHGAAA
jgi:hypothetical protein